MGSPGFQQLPLDEQPTCNCLYLFRHHCPSNWHTFSVCSSYQWSLVTTQTSTANKIRAAADVEIQIHIY